MVATRSNPMKAAHEAYRVFHGQDADEVFEFSKDRHYHSVLAGCGRLIRMEVLSLEGYQCPIWKFGHDCLLSMNERRTQLFIVGGDQTVNLEDFGIVDREVHDSEVLGEFLEVQYHTTKVHLTPETGGRAVYKHQFGGRDDDGQARRRPLVLYDVLNSQLSIAGGDYKISAEGIVY